ncbi:hypothetical protein RSOLAG1IB_09632 [Rhizoctonia solani AG-1 IB]|uniref:Protein kinase domain-containing protein n=1 Tax=Thanatephorus cucumeris (strain AG1-IB / isolate 7/3/14) TaxID=1108050 RepID=A0A0B7FQZ9_THACB|nr:hypothetical protein RSOLAG1IB_09632 [Rhizoctonia solani AG-1 IB]
MKKRISREIIPWNAVTHPNILPFYGLYWADGPDDLPAMVYPYCKGGNCSEFLINNPGVDRMGIVRQVADGLHYLHSFKPPIAHGDIKAANILMQDDDTPLIADFGLSRVVMEFSTGLTTSSSKGSYRWMAPELFGGVGNHVLVLITAASDVWAFGCLCLEILLGVLPWASRSDAAIMLAVVKDRLSPPLPSSTDASLGHIMRHCWMYEAAQRPSMLQLVDALLNVDPERLHLSPCTLSSTTTFSDSPPTIVNSGSDSFTQTFSDSSLISLGSRYSTRTKTPVAVIHSDPLLSSWQTPPPHQRDTPVSSTGATPYLEMMSFTPSDTSSSGPVSRDERSLSPPMLGPGPLRPSRSIRETRVTIAQRKFEKIKNVTTAPTVEVLQKDQYVPKLKAFEGVQRDLQSNSSSQATHENIPELNQPEASAQHPHPVPRDEKQHGSRKHRQKNTKLRVNVPTDWDLIRAKANCIIFHPLTQLVANIISNKSPTLLTFNHGDIPGPIFTVNSFLAYGMTDGCIGLVFRHNGGRAALKLPAAFGRNASVVDLSISGNYLACITNGGGAIVWNIPDTYSREPGISLTPLLQVPPCGLRRVKWNGQGKIALLSTSEVCLFDIYETQSAFGGLVVPWKDLVQFAQRYSVSSFLVSFEFHAKDATLTTISVDSILSVWSMETQRTIWQGKILGDGDPSSIHIIENGVIIGRNRGCTIQLLAHHSTDVLSTITFQSAHTHSRAAGIGQQMYAHLCYDARLHTMWIANSERSSLIAVRVSMDLGDLDPDSGEVLGTFEKFAEFPTPVSINGMLAFPDRNVQGSSLAVVTTVSQETRVDLLDINQPIFESSLRVLHTEATSSVISENINGVSTYIEPEKLQNNIDQSKLHQYFESQHQSIPNSGTLTESTTPGTSTSLLMDIAYPKEMSTDDMFECLTFHGCPDLTNLMNPGAFSKGFVVAGGFGDIWKGRLYDETAVAIKVWRFRTINEDAGKDLKRAMREIYNWSKLEHKNIHKLLGVIVFEGRLGMVSKWMEKGNLQNYLHKNKDVDRYPLCIQLAQGVEYLHNNNMIHGDLKAINVLVSSDDTLKLTDFDHSIMAECTLQFSETTRIGGGTLRWMHQS